MKISEWELLINTFKEFNIVLLMNIQIVPHSSCYRNEQQYHHNYHLFSSESITASSFLQHITTHHKSFPNQSRTYISRYETSIHQFLDSNFPPKSSFYHWKLEKTIELFLNWMSCSVTSELASTLHHLDWKKYVIHQ